MVRRDALTLMKAMLAEGTWRLQDGVPRGLNLYSDPSQTFEVSSLSCARQLLGGGTYEEGAGWALGLERLMLTMSHS